MLSLVFTSDDSTHKKLEIEFFQNTFVSKYLTLLEKRLNELEYIDDFPNLNVVSSMTPYDGHDWDQVEINRLTGELKLHIQESVKLVGIPYPIDLSLIKFTNKSSHENNLLNFIHRSFTSMFKNGFSSWNNKDFHTPIVIDDPEFIELRKTTLNKINTTTHLIQDYYYQNNPRVSKRKHKELLFKFNSNDYIEFVEEDFNFRATSPLADIWLPVDCMTGKNYQTGYTDYDNPTMYDIVNENLYNGDFSICNRNTFISEAMKGWLKKYNEPTYYGVPLGNIITGKKWLNEITHEYCLGDASKKEYKYKLKEIYW